MFLSLNLIILLIKNYTFLNIFSKVIIYYIRNWVVIYIIKCDNDKYYQSKNELINYMEIIFLYLL